jgi:hypothetical protein
MGLQSEAATHAVRITNITQGLWSAIFVVLFGWIKFPILITHHRREAVQLAPNFEPKRNLFE